MAQFERYVGIDDSGGVGSGPLRGAIIGRFELNTQGR